MGSDPQNIVHLCLYYIDDAVDQDVNDVDHGDLNGTPSTQVRVLPAPRFVLVCRPSSLVWSPPPVHFNQDLDQDLFVLLSLCTFTFNGLS